MSWTQIGSSINGEAMSDSSGYSVALSGDGTVVAIGAPGNDGTNISAGHVRIYKNISDVWTQIGADIDGETGGDISGWSVALSNDGTVLAIGAPDNDASSSNINNNAGSVRVYKNVNNTWTKISNDTTFDGGQSGGKQGWSVALSGNGLVLARGGIYSDGDSRTDNGAVRLYRYASGTTWNAVAYPNPIFGRTNTAYSGYSLALNFDGSYISIGAPGNDENSSNSGHVAVYYGGHNGNYLSANANIFGASADDQAGYSVALSHSNAFTQLCLAIGSNKAGTTDKGAVRVYRQSSFKVWSQLGSTIVGENDNDQLGTSVALSSDGTILAAGAPNNANGKGMVSVYKNIQNVWVKLGSNIIGESSGDNFGFSLDLSNDGTILAVGAPYNNGNGSDSGNVRIFRYIPPPTPTVINSITVSQRTATINFTQSPVDNSITSYKYSYSTTGLFGTYTSYVTSNWTSGTSFTVPDLTIGTTYHFKVIAFNNIDGPESEAFAVTIPNFEQLAPVIVSATGANTVATINFTQDVNDSLAIINYAYSTDAVITQNSVFKLLPANANGTFQTTSPLTISGLSNGETYSFTLKAFNGSYSSASSTISNVLVSFPQAPPSIQGILGADGTATIRFTQQTNNSNPITGYGYSTDAIITESTVFTLISSTTSPLIISGLTNNQEYSFTLSSYNGSYSRPSATVKAIIYPPPPAPVITSASSATESVGAVIVNFTQQSSVPEINYYLYSTNGTTFNPLPLRNGQIQRTSPFYIDGLNGLQTYSLTFKSHNGIISAASNSVSVFTKYYQPPPVITNIVSDGEGVARITISQSLNASDSIQNYYYNIGNGWRFFDPPQTSSTLFFDNLSGATNFNFTLRSFNGYASGDSNTFSNIPVYFSRPQAPTVSSINFTNNRISVTVAEQTTVPSIIKYMYSTSEIIDSTTVFYDFENSLGSGVYDFPYSASSGDVINITIRGFNGKFSLPSTTVKYTVLVNTVTSATNNTVLVSMINRVYTINGRRSERVEICYSTNGGSSYNTIERWPFIIGNSSNNVLTVRFATDISLSVSNIKGRNEADKLYNKIFPVNTDTTKSFFVINGNKITIEGNSKDILIDSINFGGLEFSSLYGFIQNGTEFSSGFNDITIQNLNIRQYSRSTLVKGEGLLCSAYFGRSSTNNLITNCDVYNFSNPDLRRTITSNSGGISGQYTGINSTNFVISNCAVECSIESGINGENAGGIVGSNSGSLSDMLITNCTYTGSILGKGSGGIIGAMCSNIRITNCQTTGSIYSGGIAGTLTGVVTSLNSGLVEITDCNTTGNIISVNNSNSPGGIVSDYAGTVTITRCYSKGQIGAVAKNSSGGIIGSYAGSNGGSVIIDKCFSLGNISYGCGGIAADNFGVYSGKAHVIKLSYSVGDIDNNAGGIAGPNIGPGYTNTLNYDFQSNPSNPVFTGLGYGYGSATGSSNRNAFINILGCFSYGSLSNSYSGGIIARTTQTYPTFLTGNKFFLRMITIHGCAGYGTSISTNIIQSSYQNFVNSSYEDIYNNNSIIGAESTLPPVQGIFDNTITEYDGNLLNDISNVILDTSTNALNNIDIKPRINTGLYFGISIMPNTITLTKLLNLAYPINTIINNNFGTLYTILNTTNITPTVLTTVFGGQYTIRSLVDSNISILGLLVTKFNMSYSSLITQGITPIEFYNANIYSISWFRDTLGYKVLDFLNNGFSLMSLFPTYTIHDVYNEGYTANLFSINNVSAVTYSLIPGVTIYDFEGSLYNPASTASAYRGGTTTYTRNPNGTNTVTFVPSPNPYTTGALTLPSGITGDNIQMKLYNVAYFILGHNWNNIGYQGPSYSIPSAVSQLPLNFTSADLVGSTITVNAMLLAGLSRRRIAALNYYTVEQLRLGGFTTNDLITVGYTNSEMLAGGFSSTQVNAAQIQTRQPAPVITEIITYQDYIEVGFKQIHTNCSAEIITYYYSLDGITFTLLQNPYQITSPLIIPIPRHPFIQTENIIVDNLYIGSYNGLPSAVPNRLVRKEPIPFNGIPTLTQSIVQAINLTGAGLNPECLPTAGVTSIPGTGNVGFVGAMALGPMGMGVLPGADENYGAEPALQGSNTHIARNVATQLVAAAITMTPAVGFSVQVADRVIQWLNFANQQAWEGENHQKLVETDLNIDWVNYRPTITNVTYSSDRELKIYFTTIGNDDIDGFFYSITNYNRKHFWTFVSGQDLPGGNGGYTGRVNSPLIIKNVILASDDINQIRIASFNEQQTLYNGIYSKLMEIPGDYGTYNYPVKRFAYSIPSNAYSFTPLIANIAPQVKMRDGYSNVPQILPSLTEPNAIDVWFVQKNVNAGASITKYAYSIDNGKNYNYGDELVSPFTQPYSSQNPYTFRGLPLGKNMNIIFRSWNGKLSRDGKVGYHAAIPISSSVISGVYGAPSVPVITTTQTRYNPNNTNLATIIINFTQPKYTGEPITGYYYTTDNGVTWSEVNTKTSPILITINSNGLTAIARNQTLQIRIKATNQLPSNTLPASITTTNNVYNQQNIILRDLGFRFGYPSEQSNIVTVNV